MDTNLLFQFFQLSGTIIGEFLVALVLAIIMFAMIMYREHRKSSVYLFCALAVGFLFLLGDAASYYNLCIAQLPNWLMYITYFISYTFGLLILLFFTLYSGTYIREKTPVRKWVYQIPVAVTLLSVIIAIVYICTGSVFGVVDGKMTEINGLPIIVTILQSLVAIYLPIVAFTKIKQIGIKAVMLLGLFGIIPIVLAFIVPLFAGVATALSLVIVYILLQCDSSQEKERQKEKLENLNKELSHANEEKLEQIEEISALNTQLEESTAEQEAQIEEITALNTQLEESAAEQEAQIEEISALNTELEERQELMQRQLAVIDTTSKRYFCIYTFNLTKGTFHEISTLPTIHEMLGSKGDAQKPLDLAWRHFVIPEDQQIMRDFHDISRWGEYLQDKDIYSVEYRGVTSGWSRATLFAASRNEGALTGVVYTLEKIHEQKEAELTLANQINEIKELNTELEERQAQLEESAATQEAQLDEIQQLNITLNKEMEVIKGVASTFRAIYYIDLSDHSYFQLNAMEHVKDVIGEKGDADMAFVRMQQHLIDAEYVEEMTAFTDLSTLNERLQDKDWLLTKYISNTGAWFEATFIAASRDSDGNCTNVIWTIRDIDEYRQKEVEYEQKLKKATDEAEAANEAKSSFLFNMSHDIRTPMNAIIGFRDLLEKHQDEPKKRADYLKKIDESSSVLLSIINNVLEMARIEKGTIEIDETAWSAEQFNDTLYSIFQELMKEKGVTFTRQVVVQNHYVFCDPIKLREIFINILSNAYKYTPTGGSVNMHLEEVPSDREGYAMYRTTITDTGIGMSEEFLPHIFEEFAREHNTTDNKIEGTGLGMPIVKRLLEFMGGTIEVKSQKGVGSTFIVTIPHKIAEKSNLVDHAGVEIDPRLFEGKRILLAEDNDLNAEIACEILGEAGFVVERAEDGAKCVDMLEQNDAGYYDIVLMDIQMPNMNGYEAARAIRALGDSAKANVKILAMTANAFEEDKREAMRAGMNGHLAKPINVTELMKTLAGILG